MKKIWIVLGITISLVGLYLIIQLRLGAIKLTFAEADEGKAKETVKDRPRQEHGEFINSRALILSPGAVATVTALPTPQEFMPATKSMVILPKASPISIEEDN